MSRLAEFHRSDGLLYHGAVTQRHHPAGGGPGEGGGGAGAGAVVVVVQHVAGEAGDLPLSSPLTSTSLLSPEFSTSMSRLDPRNCWRQLSYAIKNQLVASKAQQLGALERIIPPLYANILLAPRWFFMA